MTFILDQTILLYYYTITRLIIQYFRYLLDISIKDLGMLLDHNMSLS